MDTQNVASECYSTLKMKGILTHCTTCVNLGDMLSELRSQSQKANGVGVLIQGS